MTSSKLKLLSIILSTVVLFTACSGKSAAEDKSNAAASSAETAETAGSDENPAEKEKPEKEDKGAESADPDNGSQETASKEDTENTSLPEYRIEKESYGDENDNFYGDFQRVVISDDNHPVLKEALEDYYDACYKDYMKVCDNYKAEVREIAKEAESSGEEDPYIPSYSHGVYSTVTRADNKMFSICVNEYDFTGGAHGSSTSYGVNFDPETGTILSEKDIGEIADSVQNFVFKTIDASGENAKEMLFPEYVDTIKERFSLGMDEMAYWFDDARLVVAFQQYDIAPYAAGILEFGVPYADLRGFNEKYLPEEDFCSVTLHDNGFVDILDVDGDGEEETVRLETRNIDENGYGTFVLHKGDESTNLKFEYYYYANPIYVHSGDNDYFFIRAATDNDWNDTEMLDAKSLDLIEEFEGYVSHVDKDKVTVTTRQNALGTWAAEKDYTYGSKGITTDQDTYRINVISEGEDRASLTLLKDLDYHTEPGKENSETLKKEMKIYPVTLSAGEIGFETESGEAGYISYKEDAKNGGILINGINENDLFDGIMYAG